MLSIEYEVAKGVLISKISGFDGIEFAVNSFGILSIF